jgi:glycosyltransferase involved in cell wall biosynthesis
MEPLVSIGMPVFNCEKTLNIAVQSILNQTYTNWELILIDDGSKDRTLEIANSFQDSRITVISDGQNQQLPIRLNQAIALSRGKYFARMDGDDVSYPERLQRQVEYLEQHTNIDLLGTGSINFHKDGKATGLVQFEDSHAGICAKPWANFILLHPTWMGKLNWFQKYQYRPDAIRMEDYDILLRTYQSSQFAAIPDLLLGYCVPSSLSLKKILTGRYYQSRILIKKVLTGQNWIFAYGLLLQIAKSLVEIFSVATGTGFKFLKHRIGRPAKEADLVRWQQIWSQCNKDCYTLKQDYDRVRV